MKTIIVGKHLPEPKGKKYIKIIKLFGSGIFGAYPHIIIKF